MELGEATLLAYFEYCRETKMAMQHRASAISVRKATSEDALGILACLREAFEDYRELYTPDAFLDTVLTPEMLQERLKQMTLFVAVDAGNQVVGTIACSVISAGEGHLRGMAVLPSMRGAGIAAQLLCCAEAELRQRNCSRITLDTTEPLERAMHFYEKHGYCRSGRVSDFFGMPLMEYQKISLENN
jgi:N-acetylglutamate synthase-like GNAT family acetyltransferase